MGTHNRKTCKMKADEVRATLEAVQQRIYETVQYDESPNVDIRLWAYDFMY